MPYVLIDLWKPVLEIAILWFVIYRILLFFEGTRSIQVLRGIIILIVAFFLFSYFKLDVLEWLLKKWIDIAVLTILIIFQPEIRQGLARLGQRHLAGRKIYRDQMDVLLKEVINAVDYLCKNKIGALIAIEKNDPLLEYIETGVAIDAQVSSEMIQTVFTPNSLLHDGGMIIQNARVMSAGCFFPLSQNQDLSRVYGTRHRAAIGLSEETDAIIIVVSEERRDISLVYKSRMHKDISKEELFSKIQEIYKS